MAGGSVLTATQTETIMDNATENPVIHNGQRQVVHVTLVFDGVDCDPAVLYDMLDSQYGTVEHARNYQNGHGIYIFNVSA